MSAPPPSEALEALLEAAQKLLDIDPANASELAQTIHQKSQASQWLLGQAKALLILGMAEHRQGNLNPALEAFLGARAGFQKLRYPQGCLDSLIQLGRLYRDQGDLTQAEQALSKALELAQANSVETQADIYNLQASIFNATGNFSKALQALNSALEMVEQLGLKQREANVLNNLGILLTTLGDFPRALEHLTKAYQIVRDIDPTSPRQALILGSIGNLYRETGENQKALQYYQQVLDIGLSAKNHQLEASALNNMGNAHCALGNTAEALKLYGQALDVSRQLGFKPLEVDILDGMGQLYAMLGDFTQAIQIHQQALEIAQEIQDREGEIEALINLGRDYLPEDTPQAVELLQQGLEAALEVSRHRSVFEAHQLLADAYEKMGDPQAALRHHREFHRVERELFNEQSQRKAQVLSTQFEIEQARREADLLHIRIEAAQTAQAEAETKVSQRTQELEQAQLEIVMRLAIAAEYRDDKTGEHTWRVGRNAALIAERLSVNPGEVSFLRSAARLHDVGKIGIPDAILLKPDRLTLEEFKQMQTHTLIGARILSGGQSGLLRMAEQIALTHHERWDGKGYPYGLSGEEIPLVGRIVAVADVFDALTHERPYKRAWTAQEALAEIERQSGSQFDPQVVRACLEVFNRFEDSYTAESLLEDPTSGWVLNMRLEQSQWQMAEKDIAGIKEHFETLLIERTRELEVARRHAVSLARRMELMAHTDVLSGLGNRRAFETDLETHLTQAMRLNQPVSVVSLDMDNLKIYNDAFGHERGDALLREFATLLSEQLRPYGTVYRIGGDEFAALLPQVGPEQHPTVLATIEQVVKNTLAAGFSGINASAGLACYPHEAQTEGDLMRLSDQRMYQTKLLHRKESWVLNENTPA